jgi:hypothetical protein
LWFWFGRKNIDNNLSFNNNKSMFGRGRKKKGTKIEREPLFNPAVLTPEDR